jgi:hypothetical protein
LKNFKKYVRLIRNNFTLNPQYIFFYLRHALTLFLLNLETSKQFADNYGDFHRKRDLRDHRLLNPTSEGGAILGEVVCFASSEKVGQGKILFAGDRNDVKEIWSKFFPKNQMVTCGLHEMDHLWNFEFSPPESLRPMRFRLIVSQAMIEHLIDPFKHVGDLVSLLDNGGVLVLNSVLPGFFYHRVPIDCFRFYPDWFETVASRLRLVILDKQISVFNITYKLQKP